jgi:putative protease
MEVEEVQSGREMELEEDSHGTYFFSSKDLNLIAHMKELRDAGVVAFKIEGRNKSAYYVASVTRAYRQMIDAIESKKSAGEIKKIQRWAQKELEKNANRGYNKGFLFGNEPEHNYSGETFGESHQFVGEVTSSQGKELTVKIHNALRKNDKIEIIAPEKNIPIKILAVYNKDREEVASAHGGHGNLYFIKIDKKDIKPLSLLRKIVK